MLINGNLGLSIQEGEEMDHTKTSTTISSRWPLPMSFVTRTEVWLEWVEQTCMLLQHLEECYLAVAIPSQSVQSRPSQITTGEVAKNSHGNSSEGDAVLQTKLYSSSCWFHQVIADAWRLDTCIFVVTEILSIEKKRQIFGHRPNV